MAAPQLARTSKAVTSLAAVCCYAMCILPWRFQIIACASLSVGKVKERRERGWGEVLRMGAVPVGCAPVDR